MSFTIVTACSRPENLPRILDSIVPGAPKDTMWVVIHDLSSRVFDSGHLVQYRDFKVLHTSYVSGNKGWGHQARNEWLDQNVLGWTYFLDDDNLLHPQFWECMKKPASAPVQIFSQERSPGSMKPANAEVCHVDLAQCVFLRESVGDLRFGMHYEADGEFIRELSLRACVELRPEVACYYNRLKW